jgi:hypothetical protein
LKVYTVRQDLTETVWANLLLVALYLGFIFFRAREWQMRDYELPEEFPPAEPLDRGPYQTRLVSMMAILMERMRLAAKREADDRRNGSRMTKRREKLSEVHVSEADPLLPNREHWPADRLPPPPKIAKDVFTSYNSRPVEYELTSDL